MLTQSRLSGIIVSFKIIGQEVVASLLIAVAFAVEVLGSRRSRGA